MFFFMIKVVHHIGAHGQRYKEDTNKAKLRNQLVKEGTTKIKNWVTNKGGGVNAARQFSTGSFDGRSATKKKAKDVRKLMA
ncbi:unnamed protein product [Choristocarpus tenellus]